MSENVTIYLLRHPDPKGAFRGNMHGIDFHPDGRGSSIGSTSSKVDRDHAVDVLGCVDVTDSYKRPK